MAGGAEGEDAFLGPALFLVAPRPAEGRVEAIHVERLLQAFGLPQVGVQRPMVERVDVPRLGFGILVDEQLDPVLARRPCRAAHTCPELPARIDMKQRERQRRRIEGLAGEVQHHRAVLADRIEHHRPRRFGDRFAHDVDALGLEPVEMGKGVHDNIQATKDQLLRCFALSWPWLHLHLPRAAVLLIVSDSVLMGMGYHPPDRVALRIALLGLPAAHGFEL